MNRFVVTSLFFILTALGLGGCQAGVHNNSKPNIVLIIADDLGPGDLGCYGQRIIRTPNIDSLAARGVRFTNAYSGAPVCAPSRCTLLTGKSAAHAAIRDNLELKPTGQQPLPADQLTIASVLRSNGYRTACIGKWGLGIPESSGDPLRHGFDHFFGYYCQRHAHNHAPDHLFRNGTRVELSANSAVPSRGDAPIGAYAPDLMKHEALEFIRSNSDRPFFLFYATTVPHLALQVPEDSLGEYEGALPDSPYDGKKGYLPHRAPRAAYAAMVSRFDRDIGEIVDALRRNGQFDNTLFIVTSDNGPTYTGGADSTFFNSSEARRGLKGQLYDGGIRVPLLVAGDARIPHGVINDAPCVNYDFFPTLCAAAGINPPHELDGVSLWDMLTTGVSVGERTLYWETPAGSASQAVRMGDWKAVRNKIRTEAPTFELFNVRTDPSEAKNVASEHPDVVARFERIFRARETSQIAAWNFPTP